MIIESNGISIERLREKDIEMVRRWRNSNFVKQHMNFRETITPEMQKEWFKSVDNFNNFYFLIIYKNIKVGLGNIKDVNWEERTGEAGVFVTKQNFTGSFLPVVGALTLSDIVFKVMKFNRLLAQIRTDNPRSKKFNRLMGFKMAEGQEGKESQLHYLTGKAFYRTTKKFFLLMKPMGFNRGNMSISFDKEDFDTGFADKFIELIETSDLKFKRTEKDGNTIFSEVE